MRTKRLLAAAVAGATVLVVAPTAPAHASPKGNYQITLAMSECGIMALGTRGTCIVSLQTWLNASVGANLVVDGHFGPATHRAVIKFQRKFGLVPDGQFGPASRRALNRWVSGVTAEPPVLRRVPCTETRTCDPGAAVASFNSGTGGIIACAGVGLLSPAAGAVCAVFLS